MQNFTTSAGRGEVLHDHRVECGPAHFYLPGVIRKDHGPFMQKITTPQPVMQFVAVTLSTFE
jgi:hypothetical protein